ncbi:HNH endonuclease signature motif containing protein [Massilia sp. YMA4]|uniref:HNH endonuclease signature motif containing protein n=1 Tax=Massilia sp. YMA4 TaxID=1593482 RepID=UPI001582A160|nr:HNH endonuclease signature motif containing protein [Massilia sp. YMA4]
MQGLESAGKPFVKAHYYKQLAAAYPERTEKSFEFRMQNISAVLHKQGSEWLSGVRPKGNVGTKNELRLGALLAKHPHRLGSIPPAIEAILSGLRDWLIGVARRSRTVTYGETWTAFGLDRFSLPRALGIIGHNAHRAGEPILTAVVVNKETGRCGSGFENEYSVNEDEERAKLYEYWRVNHPEPTPLPEKASFMQRQAKFVSFETRPDQAAFRKLLFEKYDGKCVLTGCDIPEVLDAAHKRDRKWKEGHNSADDGYLLRKDLHALYDSGYLDITELGTVVVEHSKVVSHFGDFSGIKVEN